jgi:CO/xanthine dehydrogenase Mo-binding subunit
MTKIGESVTRLEDGPLLRGGGRFADDVRFPNQLHMCVVRSPVAYGRIRGIDASPALAMAGVAAVWTGADVADVPPIDFRLSRIQGLDPYRQPILAQEVVRYVGEPVAVVFAEDRYVAEDAAGAVQLDIEARAPHMIATDDPVEFAPGIDTEPAILEKGYGDIAAALADAPHLIELELRIGRHSGVPLETRGAIARVNDERDRVELYGAAKVPHYNRDAIAKMLGLSRQGLELFEGHVGGGFGVRGELYPEDVLVCIATQRLGRPVKWVEDRRENLVAMNHSRDQVHKVRAGFDDRGYILGLDDEFWSDQGAYVRTHGATVPDIGSAMLPGPYVIPAFRIRGHIRITNKTPAGTYRAPGRYESTFVRERLIDAIADRLGLDSFEVRRANFIAPDAMPFSRYYGALETPAVYDSGDYNRLLDRLLARVDYDKLAAELADRRAKGELVGAGIGYYVEKSGLGPWDDVRVEMDTAGNVEVVTGAASVGQGVETVVAQICAETLGVDYRTVRVTHGQTDRIDRGLGAFASRVTVMTGAATHDAAGRLKDMLLETAAGLLQSAVTDLEIVDGRARLAGEPDGRSVAVGEIAAAAIEAAGAEVLSVEATFEAEHMTYPYGIHLVVAAIDPETAGVTIERYVVAFDVGRAVNPMLIEGQIAGGAAQGLGGALHEEFVYDAGGQPLAANFVDYLLPGSLEMVAVDSLITEDAPSGTNALGLKGAGESGINATGAAVAAALDQALGRPGAVTRLPVTPARLHAILRDGGSGGFPSADKDVPRVPFD